MINYIVSESFMGIYQYFNVSDQRDKMKNISKEELYYLLLLCMDNHDEDDPTVYENYKPFGPEIDDILKFQESGETTIMEIINLQKELGTYISNDNFSGQIKTTTIGGNELPKLYTKDEARDIKLNNILEK